MRLFHKDFKPLLSNHVLCLLSLTLLWIIQKFCNTARSDEGYLLDAMHYNSSNKLKCPDCFPF